MSVKILFPNYENGLVNVMSSVSKHFQVPSGHNSLDNLDKTLGKNKDNNVVLVVFDGLGYNILKKNKKYCPFLNEHLKQSVSSCFPTTTMAARTTILSGLNPIEHGWLGWDMYFKKYDNVITLARNYVKGTKEKITDYNIAKTLLKYEPITDKVSSIKGCKGSVVTYYKGKGPSFKANIKKIKKITRNNMKNYVYFYCNEPDHTFHKYGTDAKQSLKMLKKLDRWFKKLCKSLKNSTVIAVADHGHLNVDYITLSDYPDVINMLKGNFSGDSRVAIFRVKDEYKKTFPLEIKKVLKDDFIIMKKSEVIQKKLYGTGLKNEYFNDALGDYFAIGVGNKAIRYDDKVHMHKSAHSGITEDEMLVPLIIYEGE